MGENRSGGDFRQSSEEDTDPDSKRRKNQPAPAGPIPSALPSSIPADSEDRTQRLTPEQLAEIAHRKPVTPRSRTLAIISVVALVVLLGSTLFVALRGRGSGVLGAGPAFDGCGDNTPCQTANAYLADYIAGRYANLDGLVSQQTIKRFDDPRILRGNYHDARDYITTRTQDIVARAGITSITASPGAVQKTSATTADVPARIEFQSARVGSFEQDITIPLVYESNHWRITGRRG